MLGRIIAPAVALALLLVAPADAPARKKLPPPPAYDVIVVARLVERPNPNLPHCGTLHLGEAMKYQVVTVEHGKLTEKIIWVAHGCPAMPRSMYNGPHAGNLQAFKIGDVHRLRLTRNTPGGAAGPSIVAPKGVRAWWAVRADLR
jgi:hypothetical protein